MWEQLYADAHLIEAQFARQKVEQRLQWQAITKIERLERELERTRAALGMFALESR